MVLFMVQKGTDLRYEWFYMWYTDNFLPLIVIMAAVLVNVCILRPSVRFQRRIVSSLDALTSVQLSTSSKAVTLLEWPRRVLTIDWSVVFQMNIWLELFMLARVPSTRVSRQLCSNIIGCESPETMVRSKLPYKS